MSIENKTVDISIEANTPYTLLMQFADVEDLNGITSSTVIDLTGCTFAGSIKADLNSGSPILENFTITLVDAPRGIVSVGLSKAQTVTLASKASSLRDKYNPRLRFLGYYDIVLTKASTSTSFRVLEGKVYISDGVTA